MSLEWPYVRITQRDGSAKVYDMGDADVWDVLARIELNFMKITPEMRAQRQRAVAAPKRRKRK